MLIREIPGFYYDEEKRRYFKVVNGSTLVNKKYHNNRVQAEKRRCNKSHETKNCKKQAFADVDDRINILKLRLGETRLLQHDLTFETIKSVRQISYKSVRKRNLKSWGIVSMDHHGPHIIVSSLYDVLLIGHGYCDFSDLMFWRHFERISCNLAPINEPTVSSLSCDGRYLFYTITVTSVDFPSMVQNYVRIERLEVDNAIRKQDFTLALYSYWKSLQVSSFQHFLGQILGVNAIDFSEERYSYLDGNLFVDTVSITALQIYNKKVYLGCSNGSIVILSFEEVLGAIKFYDSCLVNVSSRGPISMIRVLDKDFIAFTTERVITILDSQHRQIHRINHGDLIKNFKADIYPELSVIHVVGLTKVTTYRILKNGEKIVAPIRYFNDNITIQPSVIESDLMMVKESDLTIRITDLMNFRSAILPVANDDRVLVGIYKCGHEVIVHCADDSVSYFKHYT